MNKKKIAIIGAGVTGLTASWLLHTQYEVSLFEKNDYLGGHTNTIRVMEGNHQIPVDTGFIVFNNWNYPNLLGLFSELDVPWQDTDMSFAFSLSSKQHQGRFEYAGSSLNTLFAQRKNLFSLRYWKMLREIMRFNSLAHEVLESDDDSELVLSEFLQRHRFSHDLQENYLLPMGAAIWSCSVETMMKFPAKSFLQFFKNHGLISINNRPQWYTVIGGSFAYVHKMMDRMGSSIRIEKQATKVVRQENSVLVSTEDGTQEFDHVILACHADEAFTLLDDADEKESAILSCFEYELNKTYLHTDERLMPINRKVWSSWNYLARDSDDSRRQMTATYWMNFLQNIKADKEYFVTLNPYELPRDETIIREIDYQHPIFTQAAIKAQQALPSIQGKNNTWFCGSYAGYGFHEDAVKSAVSVCRDFGVDPKWENKG